MRRAAWLAAALGYLLTRGSENEYAIYSAMTAALTVVYSTASRPSVRWAP